MEYLLSQVNKIYFRFTSYFY